MKIERETIIQDLEKVRKYVNNPNFLISDDERYNLNDTLDNSVKYAKYGRYHVTTLGVFSTGKSTLLNAMLGVKLLPSADLPTTAITTEIYAAEETYFFIPMALEGESLIQNVRKGIESLAPKGEILYIDKISRNGMDFSGIGGIIKNSNYALISQIIAELTSQQKRTEEPFLELKQLLDKNHNLPLWLGLSFLPDWLKDIVLTDAPGTGSIDDSHEIIVNKVIPESQLVLYLIESAKTGSAIDKRFCDRISNTYHRKIFYVLNKIDQQNNDERIEALDCAKRCVPDVAKNGETPEFLMVAALYAHVANELKLGNLSLEDVYDDEKINLNKLLVRSDYRTATEDKQVELLIKYLIDNSNYMVLQARIEKYLKYENKELAIVQHANSSIVNVSTILINACNKALHVLKSDVHINELYRKKNEVCELRKKYKKEAENIINDYVNSALDMNTGLGATIKGLLSSVPDKITAQLSETLQDKTQYENLQKKEVLQNWITKEISYNIDDVVKKLDNELNKRYSHLIEQLLPILQKIEDESLSNSLKELKTKNSFNIDVNSGKFVGGAAVGGAVLAGGGAYILTTLGVGTSTAIVTTPATGLAGLLAGWGLNAIAVGASNLGLGALASSTATTTTLFGFSAATFFPPVIVVGAVVGVLWALFYFNKNWKIKKILETTNELMRIIVMTGGTIDKENIDSIAKKMQDSMEITVLKSAQEIKVKIDDRLQQMDEEEEKLIRELDNAKNTLNNKISAITTMQEEIQKIKNNAELKLKNTRNA